LCPIPNLLCVKSNTLKKITTIPYLTFLLVSKIIAACFFVNPLVLLAV
jgi:hypothetical protein